MAIMRINDSCPLKKKLLYIKTGGADVQQLLR